MEDKGRDKTEGMVGYLHSTLTLGFVPLQRNGRVWARNGKECFSKSLDETRSTKSGLGGSSDLSLLLLNIWQLLGVPRDSIPGIAINILMRDIVSVGHVGS